MKYLIIGLGIYGENLARDLVAMGHVVIGADINPVVIESLKNDISAVYHIDSTEENQLAVLPLDNVDLVIVAIGENFGASVKTVALLKKNGVRHIYARAIDELHEAILESFDIDRIITPEQRAAHDLSHELELGSSVITLPVCHDYAAVSLHIPGYFFGLTYKDIREKLAEDYEITLVAVCRPEEKTNIMGINHQVLTLVDDYTITAQNQDTITIFGSKKKIRTFSRKVSV